MADGRFPDSPDGPEPTPAEPTGAELADGDTKHTPAGDRVENPPELTPHGDLVDPRDAPEGPYVDDPETVDVNEAKLDRATDEVAAEATQDPGSTEPRRPRRNRPLRRSGPAGGRAGDPSKRAIQPAEPEEILASDMQASTDEAERAGAGAARGGGRTRTTAPVRKVRTQTEPDADKRTTPALFVKQSVGELRKVVWPTGTQVQQYFIVVLVFVLFIMTVVSLLDLGVGWLVLRMFG